MFCFYDSFASFTSSRSRFMHSIGVRVLTSSDRSASSAFVPPDGVSTSCVVSAESARRPCFFGVTSFPASSSASTRLARRTTSSGTPASFATSMPKLSSAPPADDPPQEGDIVSALFDGNAVIFDALHQILQRRQFMIMRRKHRLLRPKAWDPQHIPKPRGQCSYRQRSRFRARFRQE